MVYLVPPDIDRGIFQPFGSDRVLEYVADTIPIKRIHEAYESILDATSIYIYEEQRKLFMNKGIKAVTTYPSGSYVLVSYPSRPPSKLADRWMGPFMVVSRVKNTYTVRDLTSDVLHTYDVTRLKQFVVSEEKRIRSILRLEI